MFVTDKKASRIYDYISSLRLHFLQKQIQFYIIFIESSDPLAIRSLGRCITVSESLFQQIFEMFKISRMIDIFSPKFY